MTMSNCLELDTSDPEVSLLQFIETDAQMLFELIDKNREHLSQYREPTSKNYPDFDSIRWSIVAPKNPHKVRLGIWLPGNTLAGTINFRPLGGRTYEIGYWVGKEFGDRGLATVATKAVIQYGRELNHICRMVAYTHLENYASQKVLTKAGMTSKYRDDEQVHFFVITST